MLELEQQHERMIINEHRRNREHGKKKKPAPMTIAGLCRKANAASVKAGWQDEPRSFGDLIALMHSELTEAFEEFRAGHALDEVYLTPAKPNKPEGVPVELADAVIRIAQCCGQYGIDLEAAITRKMAYNETRGHRWEGKKL